MSDVRDVARHINGPSNYSPLSRSWLWFVLSVVIFIGVSAVFPVDSVNCGAFGVIVHKIKKMVDRSLKYCPKNKYMPWNFPNVLQVPRSAEKLTRIVKKRTILWHALVWIASANLLNIIILFQNIQNLDCSY